ncbi:hypothetical protein [Streptomyces sp. HB132]|uniref:hypothetical protein n=1 Tax=Streptomyces sp. HB132 TaxID=767388 RepID=UPI00195F2E9C|nr:hypothetical protein [Streptomyces sp. HB132]MBM7443013.1 hypothetical protein [Streptomyces sp. HB132]
MITRVSWRARPLSIGTRGGDHAALRPLHAARTGHAGAETAIYERIVKEYSGQDARKKMGQP